MMKKNQKVPGTKRYQVPLKNDRAGFTLIELLVVMILGAIAMMAMTMPFIAERTFWRSGREQAGSQQDAQMVMRSIAHTAREGTGYIFDVNSVTFYQESCTAPDGFQFQRVNGNQLQLVDKCLNATYTLIDGVRSEVTQFAVTEVVANKLVDIQLEIAQGDEEREKLQTQIFLRNA